MQMTRGNTKGCVTHRHVFYELFNLSSLHNLYLTNMTCMTDIMDEFTTAQGSN